MTMIEGLKEMSLNDLYYYLWEGRYNPDNYWLEREYEILEEIKSREKDDRKR